MGDPSSRARDRDRDAAIDLVEEAWAEGQLVDIDRDKRVEQLLQAQTLGEIDLLVRDLQTDRPRVPAAPPPAPSAPQRPRRGSWGWLVALVVVAVGATVAGVVSAVGGVEQTARSVTDAVAPAVPAAPAPPDVQSRRGMADLVAAVREETGSTEALRAVLYPTYAVLALPDPDGGVRGYYWNGALRRQGAASATAEGRPFDLAALDPALVTRALRAARRLVDEPTSSYVVVQPPGDDGAFLWGYAAGDGGSGYVSFDGRGRVVRTVPPS